jgi:Zn-dependent M28 family amino/carboxypeptidase
LLRFKPELIVYLDPKDFDQMKSQGESTFRLSIEGRYKKYRSANIIGIVGNGGFSSDEKSSSKEFLITAHLDTYRQNNPGASDNASGIGILLEVARHFKKIEDELDCIVKFIAFGAEEIGIFGSRNYLDTNTESLRQCELLFNIDDVGGNGNVLVEMTGGVRGIPVTKCLTQIPEAVKTHSWEGVESHWRMLADDNLMRIFAASNHPDWLVDVITKSVEELGYDIQPTGTQGSDQLAFAQAGIVTSGIGIISGFSHTPQDTPEKINKKSLRVAGDITTHVVLSAIERLSENR